MAFRNPLRVLPRMEVSTGTVAIHRTTIRDPTVLARFPVSWSIRVLLISSNSEFHVESGEDRDKKRRVHGPEKRVPADPGNSVQKGVERTQTHPDFSSLRCATCT